MRTLIKPFDEAGHNGKHKLVDIPREFSENSISRENKPAGDEADSSVKVLVNS